MRHATAGIEFGVTFLLCLGLGLWLDMVYGTIPGWLVNGGIVGFAIAMYRLLQHARQAQRDEERRQKEDRQAGGREQ